MSSTCNNCQQSTQDCSCNGLGAVNSVNSDSGCDQIISSDCIVYSGDILNLLNLAEGSTLTDIIIKINDLLNQAINDPFDDLQIENIVKNFFENNPDLFAQYIEEYFSNLDNNTVVQSILNKLLEEITNGDLTITQFFEDLLEEIYNNNSDLVQSFLENITELIQNGDSSVTNEFIELLEEILNVDPDIVCNILPNCDISDLGGSGGLSGGAGEPAAQEKVDVLNTTTAELCNVAGSLIANGPDNSTETITFIGATTGAGVVTVNGATIDGATPITVTYDANGEAILPFTIADVASSDSAITSLSYLTDSGNSVCLYESGCLGAAVTPTNQPPTASFVANVLTGEAPLIVEFDGSASQDIDGFITTYAWAFGDGATAAGQNVTHTYTVAGSYTASLTVTDNDGATNTFSRQIVVTPASIPVTGVTIDGCPNSTTVGANFSVSGLIAPLSASDFTISYSSSNPSVMTVNSVGQVTAVSAGTAIITVFATDNTNQSVFSDTCVITVATPVTNVTGYVIDNCPTEIIPVGDTYFLTSTVTPANADNQQVTFTSSDPSVASVVTVNLTGAQITANSAGTATIIGTTQDGGFVASCIVNVSEPSFEIAFDAFDSGYQNNTTADNVAVPRITTCNQNEYSVTATIFYPNYNDDNVSGIRIDWLNSNPASASELFLFTTAEAAALEAGNTITKSFSHGYSTDVATNGGTLATFGIADIQAAIVNTSDQVLIQSNDLDAVNVVGSSSDETNCDGVVLTPDPGGVAVTDAVIVLLGPGVGLGGECPQTLRVGDLGVYAAPFVQPGNATEDYTVTFTSTDTSVFTIESPSGIIVPLAPGTANIIMTLIDGSNTFSDICTIVVEN